MEKRGIITFLGNPLTLVGNEIKAGEKAPNFKVLTKDLKKKSLDDFKGRPVIICSVPSLDTPVCDAQIKRFNQEAANIASNVAIIFISMDLPFAQDRFCKAFSVDHVETLSDHKEASFGNAYGALIQELRLLTRAVFILDIKHNIYYMEYVKEISEPPNYEAALKVLKQLLG